MPCLAKEWRDQLHAYMSGTVAGLGGFPQNTGGWNDHVHLLIGMKATQLLRDMVRELKKTSNTWLKSEIGLKNFAWQENYAAFTVGYREREIIRAYIDRQEEHHRKSTSSEELRTLLKESGVEYESKYFK